MASFTEGDFDREIKELTVRKMRAELKEIEERTLKIKVTRAESEERTRLFKKLNSDFDKLIRFIQIASNGSISAPFPNLLEEAFAETISGNT